MANEICPLGQGDNLGVEGPAGVWGVSPGGHNSKFRMSN